MNGIFSLNSKDAVKGLVVAVIAATLTWLLQILSVPGFDFSTFDWGELLRVAIASGSSYMVKNFFSDNQGKVMGTKTLLGIKQ